MQRLRRLFVLSHEWNVFLILLVILSISVGSWWTVKVHLEKEWNARLQAETEKVLSLIKQDLSGYGQALSDTRAYFQTSGVPTPKEFAEYVQFSGLMPRYPGLQGLAFTEKVEKEQIPAFEKRMRLAGYGDFKFWPVGDRSLYTSISLIQPEDWRNKLVLGFDMYSESLRKQAMDKALLTDQLAITDPLVLLQDENAETSGALIYLPVTRLISTNKNLEPKNRLIGFVYAVVRIGRFFNGAVGDPQFYEEKVNYRIESFDQRQGKNILLYERFPSHKKERFGSDISIARDIAVFDKVWRVHFEPLPHFFNPIERYIPILFAFVTLVMLSVIFLALWSTQQFLKFSERHKESLALISKNKSEEISLIRKLNAVMADLSSAVDGNNLFEKLGDHLQAVFKIDDCVVFVREKKGPYEKRFQKILHTFPENLDLPREFDSYLKEGIYDTQLKTPELAKILSLFPPETRRVLESSSYYLMRCILHESGKTTSALVIMRGAESVGRGTIHEYALVSLINHFAMSYDKAILLRRAEDANLMKSSFLANMSHEIRTPLGVIVGYSEILGDEDLQRDEKEQIVKSVKRNGKELARLIDDILDISKVEAGKLHLEMERVHLEKLVQEIKSIMETRASDRKIQFNIAKLSNVPNYVVTDDVRLKQILINIVGNAIKFTEQGGVKLLYKVVSDEAGQSLVEFQIQDSGVGISEGNRQNLFKPFSQGDVSTTRKYGGTGLGLALSKRLAELLGGDLFLLESVVGRGSTFCLRIPIGTNEVEEESNENEGHLTLPVPDEKPDRAIDWSALDMKSLLGGVRILLVEDSEDNQEIFQHFLLGAGAKMFLADDGEKAIQGAFRTDPDIILMDIQIPKIDGKEATRKIRQQGFTKPIIALTAHALTEEIESCIAAGCNGQITKPVSGELLIQEVYFYLNHRG